MLTAFGHGGSSSDTCRVTAAVDVLPKRSVSPTVKAGRGLSRHLDGWQAGVLAVFIAGTAAALVVPRPVEPTELPEPALDVRALASLRAADDAQADAAERKPLDADVRALGSAIRAYGEADARGDDAAVFAARAKVAEAAARALAQGDDELVELRAFQLRAFLREVRRWRAGQPGSDELAALGGGFSRMIERNGFCDGEGRVLMDEPALRASFKKRWNEIASIARPALAVPLDEQRALARFLLAHPPVPSGFERGGAGDPRAIALARGVAEDQARLKRIDELAELDPSYPRELARGVVLYRLRRYPLALEAFRRHLEANPDGPWTLRAQNYLRAALGRARDEGF
jgi:hypothetical protein